MTQVTRPAAFDTDGDGIPNTWETAHGLDPNSASDGNGDRDGDGYTNVEEYLNELADLACPGGATMPPDTADAGAPNPADAAVPPVDAQGTPGGGGTTGTGGAGAAGSGAGGGLGTGNSVGAAGATGTGGGSATGGGASAGTPGAGGRASTGAAPGNGAAQAGGCSCRISEVKTRSTTPALVLLGFVMLALRVRKRH
jgi:MYXO-CTERM domain-containing protein